MQNCPITHITLLKHAHATQLYTAGGGELFLLQNCTREGILPDYTAEEWVPNSTAAGGLFYYKTVRERERALFTGIRSGGGLAG